MAWSKGEKPGYRSTPTADVSGGVRRAGQSGLTTPARFKRQRIDCGPSLETTDPFEQLELPSLGPSREDPKAHLKGTNLIRRGFKDDSKDSPTRWTAGLDPSVLGFETASGRPVGQADDNSDFVEIGPFPSQPSLSGDLRSVDQAGSQRIDAINPPQIETFDSSEVTSGPSSGPMPETMRHALLQMVLGNEDSDC